MSQVQNEFWKRGPPTGLRDSLLVSGLVKDSSCFAEKTQDQKNTGMKVIINSKLRPQTSKLTIPKTQRPKEAKPIIQPNTMQKSVSGFLQPVYKAMANGDKPRDFLLSRQENSLMTKEQSTSLFLEMSGSYARGFSGKRDSKVLLDDFERLIAEFQTENKTFRSFYHQFSELSTIYYLIWNELILQIKTYNSDHAKISQKIKFFFKEAFEHFPKIESEFATIIGDSEKQISLLEGALNLKEQEANNNKESVEALNGTIRKLKTEIEEQKLNNGKSQNEKKELLIQIEELNQQIGDLNYRMGVLKGLDDSKTKENEQKDKIIANLQSGILSQEGIIKKYEEEGAGYKGLFNKSQSENQEILEKLMLCEQKLAELSKKPDRISIGIITLNCPNEPTMKTKKESKKGSKQIKKQSSYEKAPLLLPKRSDDFKTMPCESRATPLDSDTNCALITEPVEVFISTQNNGSKTEDFSEKEKEEVIIKDVEIHSDISATCVNESVLRLLPLPQFSSKFENQKDILDFVPFSKKGKQKTFSWTIRQIVHVFRHGLSSNCKDIGGFISIYKAILHELCTNDQICDTFLENFQQSLLHHQSRSNSISFFFSFISGEYNVLDFQFFNVIFNAGYNMLEPEMDKTLDDPDLFTDYDMFLISKENVKTLYQMVFFNKEIPNDSLAELFTGQNSSTSFWKLARIMILKFNELYKRFHDSVSNLFEIASQGSQEKLMKVQFSNLLRILYPFSHKSFLSNTWKKFISMEKAGNESLYRSTFLSVCSDIPDIVLSVTELPYISNFHQKLIGLSDQQYQIFNFLYTRYISIIPQLHEESPQEIKQNQKKLIGIVRNSIAICDISSGVRSYRHFLQTIDLHMTQQSLYTVISEEISEPEANILINHLKMRETIASNHFWKSDLLESFQTLIERNNLYKLLN